MKSPTETLVFELGEFGGRSVANIRVRFALDDGTSSYTRKGLTLSVRHLRALRDGVDQLLAAAEATGRLALPPAAVERAA
ncbi:MAG TPA: hypothetical protein VGD56_16705 [Gemmatirosa sp.]